MGEGSITHRRLRPAAAFLLLAALVGGCSSGPAASGTGRPGSTGAGATPAATPGPTTAATPAATAAGTAALTPLPPIGDPICDLVTEEEMTAILGGKVATTERASTEVDGCNWTSSDFTVHINIHEDALTTIEALRLADRNLEELAIGEGGIYSDVSRGAYLMKGGRVLAVQIVILPAGLERRDVAVAVATAALPRF